MPPSHFPTRGHLLVCLGQTCQSRGSRLLYQALWGHLDRSGLAYYKKGGAVRLTESGCLGSCSFGPSLCVYRRPSEGAGLEEGWYAAVDFPLAARVAQAVQDGEPLPPEHRYGP